MTLPKLQKITKFEDNQIKDINHSLEQIEQHAISIQYGTAVPTLLDYGVLYIRDTGALRSVYVKTGKGTIIAI